jgi:NAD(P) transhydrogenase subunit alpha
MLTTAAGTTRPASVLVLGAGVAGLQALATARRLGAVATGSDVREAARADVLSTGAAFLDLGAQATGAGGYARELSEEERAAQQQRVAEAIGRFDVVITTAQVPGRRPPVLVDEAALAALKPGSVVVDLASGPLGGNVAGSVPDSTVTTANAVTVIGAGSLPSRAPRASSTAFSRNLCSLLATLVVDGRVTLDLEDEVVAGLLVTHDGEVVHPRVREQLEGPR